MRNGQHAIPILFNVFAISDSSHFVLHHSYSERHIDEEIEYTTQLFVTLAPIQL